MTAAGTPVDQGRHGRAIWVLIMVISLGVSLGLNIWHAVDPPEPTRESATVDGRVFLALIVGILPVIMNSLMLHVFPKKHIPAAVKWIVAALFAVALYMSMSAVYEMLDPVTGDHVRTVGMVAIIDVPALLGLYMLARKPPAESTRPVAPTVEAVAAPVARPVVSAAGDRLPTASASVERPVAGDWSPVADDRPVAERSFPVSSDRSPEMADDRSPVARPVAPSTGDRSPVARPVAPSTGDRSPVARPVAPSTGDRSPVARPVAPSTGDRSPVARPVASAAAQPVADRSPEMADDRPRKTAPAGGLSTRDRARLALAKNPALNGAELARELGVSPERGRTLLRELRREREAQEAAREAEVIHLPAAVNE